MSSRHPILLVDDNANDTELALAALDEANLGAKVVVVHDGAAALDFLRVRGPFAGRAPGAPALIILDVLMPRIHGLEVLRQIRADPDFHQLPIIMATGAEDPAHAFSRYESAHTAFLLKPLTAATLLAALSRIGCPPAPAVHPKPSSRHPQSPQS